MTDRNDHLIWMADNGYRLIPWTPRKTKHDHTYPKIEWSRHRLTPSEVRGWCRGFPDLDWSCLPEETIVLDLECRDGLDGLRDIEAFCREHGVLWDRVSQGCAVTATKSDGWHFWFRQPDGERLNGGCHIRPGVEVKAITGGVHIPPSYGYRAAVPIDVPARLPVLPDFLARAIRHHRPARSRQAYRAECYGEGERRLKLCSMAGRLRAAGLVEPELLAALLAIRDNRCENPDTITDDELAGIARDYGRRPANREGEGDTGGNQSLSQEIEEAFDRYEHRRTNADVRGVP